MRKGLDQGLEVRNQGAMEGDQPLPRSTDLSDKREGTNPVRKECEIRANGIDHEIPMHTMETQDLEVVEYKHLWQVHADHSHSSEPLYREQHFRLWRSVVDRRIRRL